jgi:hypothetical protein
LPERDFTQKLTAKAAEKPVGQEARAAPCHTGDAIAMAADATTAYIKARAEGKDVAILCDTWDIADAINQRLHHHFTAADAPSVPVARDQHVRAGDLVLSRHNDATLTVEPGQRLTATSQDAAHRQRSIRSRDQGYGLGL